MNTKNVRRFSRRGTAVVEAAVVAPLMILSMFGMMEVGYAFMVKQTVTLASREGARAAALPGGTTSDVTAAVDHAMEAANISGYTATTNLASLGPTDADVWVEVSIPVSRVTFTGSMLGGGSYTITSRTSMRREGVDSGGS